MSQRLHLLLVFTPSCLRFNFKVCPSSLVKHPIRFYQLPQFKSDSNHPGREYWGEKTLKLLPGSQRQSVNDEVVVITQSVSVFVSQSF